MSWERIGPAQAEELMAAGAVVVDVRDPASYAQGHLVGAQLLDRSTVEAFVADTPHEVPVIVYCYHGHSSQGAAAWLAGQGFDRVYSLDGGYEGWKYEHPTER